MFGSPEISRMPFMVEPIDLYAFNIPITLESMFERRSLAELVGQRLFESAAALKQIVVSLEFPLALFVPLGVASMISNRDVRRILLASPALLWALCLVAIYPILMPVHSQGGSFEKAFLTITPVLIPLGVIGIHQLIRHAWARQALVLISIVWLVWNSYAVMYSKRLSRLTSTTIAFRCWWKLWKHCRT